MKRRTKYIIFILTLLFGSFFLIPSIQWYFFYTPQDKQEAALEGDKLQNETEKKVNQTLNLIKEGSTKGVEKEYQYLIKNFITEIKEKNRVIEQNNRDAINYNKLNPNDKMAIQDTIPIKKDYTFDEMNKQLLEIKGKEKFVEAFYKNLLEDFYVEVFKDKKKVKDSIIKLGLDLQGGTYAVVTVNFNHPSMKKEYPNGVPKDQKNAMIDSAVLKIENRINKYGVSETSIQKLTDQEKIIINLPGVQEATELRQIIETVGVLEFKLVSNTGSEALNKIKAQADREGKTIFGKDRKLLPEYQKMLEQDAPDTEALFVSNKDKWGKETEVRDMLVVDKESLLGKNLKIVKASVDQNNLGQNVVSFELGSDDAKKWADITGKHINEQIAIILDDLILYSPVVRDKIEGGASQIQLGDAPIEDLQTLALILRSGSLSVPLEISEENTIGPSLGKDTIDKGITASLIGILLVIIFMLMWYSIGGFVADIVQILNLVFLLAGMALFHATLTLPGIAGVILTIGMAVDANVIIYERIKEEYRLGKTLKSALHLGWDRAFWTIMDSNITTFAAGIGLSIFGTGPIKGFAVTLCLGIVISVYTALFVNRIFMESLFDRFNFKSIRVVSLLGGNKT